MAADVTFALESRHLPAGKRIVKKRGTPDLPEVTSSRRVLGRARSKALPKGADDPCRAWKGMYLPKGSKAFWTLREDRSATSAIRAGFLDDLSG
jgi:hypothetical protein